MSNIKNKLAATSILFFCTFTPVTYASNTSVNARDICDNVIANQGYGDARQENVQINESRSNTSVTGKLRRNNGDYFEFNCVLDNSGVLSDIVINPLSRHHHQKSTSGASLSHQALNNCAMEAADQWDERSRNIVIGSVNYTGDGMYEVAVRGRHNNGTCTVDDNGNVRSVMDN